MLEKISESAHESFTNMKSVHGEISMRLSNTEMALNEKLQLQRKVLFEVEQRSKTKADRDRVEALQAEFNEMKASMEE